MSISRAISMILAAQFLVALGSLMIKQLGEQTPIYQLVLFRQGSASLLVLPVLWYVFGRVPLSEFTRFHLFRALLIGLGNALFLSALVHLPLVTVTAAIYSAPILVVILSALLLKEPLSRLKLLSVLLGFVGILLITRPSQVNGYIALAFFGALLTAANSISLKFIADKEHPFVTLFWSNAFSMVFLIPAAVMEDAPLTDAVTGVGLGLGIFYIAMTYLIIHALRHIDASRIAPAEYSGLVFAALLGVLFLGEPLDGLTLAGIAIVFLSVLLPDIQKLSRLKRPLRQSDQ